MLQSVFSVVVLSIWATLIVAEPPAYGSSSDEFDINSISTYLDDDQSASGLNSKGIGYSFSNAYHTQNSSPERYKGSSSPFTFGQKSPTVSSVSASSPYSSASTSYQQHQAFSSASQSDVGDYSGSNGGSNYGSNYDAYSGHPVGLGSYSNAAFSTYGSSPLVAHGTNAVPYTASPLKPVASTHSNSLSGLSGGGTFSGVASSASYPTSIVGGTSSHISSPYDGHDGNSFSGHPSSSLSGRPPYTFEKPSSAGPPHFISSYKGGVSPFNSFEGPFSSKPSRHPSLYKGFSSGPPPHITGGGPPSGPASHITTPLSYKSPYYSEYKGGPGIYYSSRPPSPYSGYNKSPNNYETYSSSPYKYVSESPRYPRFPGKYSSSRPAYSASKLSYSSRPPPIYATGYKSYGSKSPSSSLPSYSGHF